MYRKHRDVLEKTGCVPPLNCLPIKSVERNTNVVYQADNLKELTIRSSVLSWGNFENKLGAHEEARKKRVVFSPKYEFWKWRLPRAPVLIAIVQKLYGSRHEGAIDKLKHGASIALSKRKVLSKTVSFILLEKCHRSNLESNSADRSESNFLQTVRLKFQP